MNTETFEAQVQSAVKAACGDGAISLYKLAQLSCKLGRNVRAQQLYRYRAEKLIANLNSDGTISAAAAEAFLLKFVGKRINK